MDVFLNIVNNIAAISLPVFLFGVSLKKRKLFLLRLTACTLIYYGLMHIPHSFDVPVIASIFIDILYYLFQASLIIVSFMICYRSSVIIACVNGIFAYAVLHLAYCIFAIVFLNAPYGFLSAWFYCQVPLYITVEVGAYFVFIHKNRNREVTKYNALSLIFAFCILLFCIVLNLVTVNLPASAHRNLCFVYDIICTVLSLSIIAFMSVRETLSQSLEVMREKWKSRLEYAELSRENIENLNRRCHDLRHQLAAVSSGAGTSEAIRGDVEPIISEYDAMPKTGNAALDTIIAEKSFFAAKNSISFTYMCDSECVGFLETLDLFVLLGNAMENAMEYVLKFDNSERRIVNLSIRERNGIVTIRTDNPCDAVQFNSKIGLPLTTKKDGFAHGIGLKSMKLIAEKYGGTLSAKIEDGLFILIIAFPHKTLAG